MSFIDSVKKKFLGDDSQVQKAPAGGKRVGSMGKAYTGGGGSYVSSSKGTGFDASTYRPDAKPRGKVGSLNEFNPNRSGAARGGEKGLLGQAAGYGVSKAKAGIGWMQERGHELNESPAYERAEHRGRKPRERRDRSEPQWTSIGTIFSGGEAYEEVAPRRKKKKTTRRKTSVPRHENDRMMEPGHVPSYLRDMF